MSRKALLSGIAAVALFSAAPVAVTVLPDRPGGAAPVLGISQAHAQDVDVDINIFFDRLEPYGSWVRHDRYRYIWVPDDVDPDWAPYTVGRWVYVENHGWTFVADEPYGWATYHYGRWAFDRDIGWYWVPGTRWAPAWVSWRRGPDYVGWAPLPPEDDGFVVSVDITIGDIPEDRWWFVPAGDFLAPNLRTVVFEAEDRRRYYERSEPVGHVVVEGDVIVNTVIDIDFIEERTQQTVEVRRIERVADPEQAEVAASTEGDTISVFAPELPDPPQNVEYDEAVEREAVADRRRTEQPEDGDEQQAEAPEEADAPAQEQQEAAEGRDAEAEGDAQAETEQPAEAEAAAEARGEAERQGRTAREAEATPQAEAEADAPEADRASEAAAEAASEAAERAEAAEVDQAAEERPRRRRPESGQPARAEADAAGQDASGTAPAEKRQPQQEAASPSRDAGPPQETGALPEQPSARGPAETGQAAPEGPEQAPPTAELPAPPPQADQGPAQQQAGGEGACPPARQAAGQC